MPRPLTVKVKRLTPDEQRRVDIEKQIGWNWQPPDMRERRGNSLTGQTGFAGSTGVNVGSGYRPLTIRLKQR